MSFDISKIKNKEDKSLISDALKLCENKFYRASYIMAWLSCAESLKRRFYELGGRDSDAGSLYRRIKELEKHNDEFEYKVSWGVDLQTEHERFLSEKIFKRPVFVTDYPKEIKAFYMKQNEDGKTVRAMDVLFPKIGEIRGGSEREANYTKLLQRMKELNMNTEKLWWYLESRKFGTVPHSGFGLGFERLMLFITGMTNIRDVIPFPRTPRNANF